MNEILPHIIDGGLGLVAVTGAGWLLYRAERERREVIEPLTEAIRELNGHLMKFTGSEAWR